MLKHQSTLLMEGFDPDENQNNLRLLMEIEDLKRTLEDERNRHNREICSLQVKLSSVMLVLGLRFSILLEMEIL